MKRKTILYLFLAGFTGLMLVIIIYGFFFGPLFPYCPIKPGFNAVTQGRFTIYYPKKDKIFPEYKDIDGLMTEVEQFHKLTFKKKVRIVICATKGQHKRFSMGGGHANTIQTGTVIYIAPSLWEVGYPPELAMDGEKLNLLPPAKEGSRPVMEFIKHELSHAILYQNTSLWKALKIKSWLEEGLAVYSGNRNHYYQGKDLELLAIDQHNFFDIFNDKAIPPHIPREILHTFRYGMFCAFIDYLITIYGLDTVLDFVHAYIQAPEQESDLFNAHFGLMPEEALKQFQTQLERN